MARRPPDAWATRNISGSPQRRGEHLHADRQSVGARAERHADPRVAGQVGRDRVRVAQVHRVGVLGLGSERERNRGRGGRDEHVGVLVGAGEVVGDQPAHLQRLAVVGLVVAGGQRVRAEHDAPLDLVAEARRPRGHVHRVGVRCVDPQAVPHAVVARQVARRLGRRDQVVRRQPVGERRHLDVDDLGAGVGEGVERGLDAAPARRGRLPSGRSVMRPTAQPFDAVVRGRRRDGRRRPRDRRRVGRVVTGDDLERRARRRRRCG